MNINQVRANLTARGIYPSFLQWWNNLWGVNGLAVQYFSLVNTTDGSTLNASVPLNFNELAMTTVVNGVLVEMRNIPAELQQVVNWVLQLVNQQVRATCGQCAQNLQSGIFPSANATMNITQSGQAGTATVNTPGTATGTGTGT